MIALTSPRIVTVALHLILLVVASPAVGNDQPVDDLRTIRGRLLEPLLEPPDAAEVREAIDAALPDGSWPDIDYSSQDRAGWPAVVHLNRLLVLTRAYRTSELTLPEHARLRDVVFASLDFWLCRDPRNPNWWWNQIGAPKMLAPVMLLLDSELSDQQRTKGLEILRRAKLGMTGQNLVWVAGITITRGVLQDDVELVNSAVKRIADETRVLPNHEGIQADYSFHQHGPCLYSHGYGAGFASDVSRFGAMAASTRFAFDDDRVATLARLILDGHQWFVWNTVADYGAIGRQISRQGNSVAHMGEAAQHMLRLPTGRDDEFHELAKRVAGQTATPLVGNRHFWRSDMMVHRRPGFMASARMFSRRTYSTDAPCNSEGLKSHHLADGCNYLFRTGREYADIFPVWDWQKVPGTTVEQTPKLQGSVRRKGSRDFVGGVSDGEYGLAAFDLHRDGLTARKAWVFFDREYVCLGAGIDCESDNPVATTVNQCLLNGPVAVLDGRHPRVVERGDHELENPAWIHHDSTAYFFVKSARVRLANRSRAGDWQSINHRYSDKPVNRDVFTLWIDHGSNPRAAAYSYVVVPGVSAPAAVSEAIVPAIEVPRNDSKLQAVRQTTLKVTGAAFYEPGRLTMGGELTLSVDQPCLVLARENEEGLTISVSNPKNEPLDVQITVEWDRRGGDAVGGACTQVHFALPGGLAAGSTVTKVVGRPRDVAVLR